MDIGHGPLLGGIPHPDRSDDLRGVADEPGISVVLGGPRLAGSGATDGGSRPSAIFDDPLQAGRGHGGRARVEHPSAHDIVLVKQAALGVGDPYDGHREGSLIFASRDEDERASPPVASVA